MPIEWQEFMQDFFPTRLRLHCSSISSGIGTCRGIVPTKCHSKLARCLINDFHFYLLSLYALCRRDYYWRNYEHYWTDWWCFSRIVYRYILYIYLYILCNIYLYIVLLYLVESYHGGTENDMHGFVTWTLGKSKFLF